MTKETVSLGKFTKGINNVNPPTDLPEQSLVSAINVDIDNGGNVHRRSGYTLVYSGSNIHSLHKEYFVEGSSLRDLSGNIYRTDIPPNRFLSWEEVLTDDYYSDGTGIYSVTNGLISVPTPSNNPELQEVTGNLSTGTYQITIAFQDESGNTGGSLRADTITVGNGSGILLSNIPQENGYSVVIYCSSLNGEELYKQTVVSYGTTSYTLYSVKEGLSTLQTQFMEPLPGGHILRHFKARLYIANGSTLWFSEPFRYGLHYPSKNFFSFPDKISIVQPIENGIYVVADKTYFLSGTEPSKMNQVIVSEDRGISGTGIKTNGKYFGLPDSICGFWFTTKGAVLGLPNGELKQLTDTRLALETDIQSGTTMFKEVNGIRQMVTSMSSKGSTSSFEFSDHASSYIIRNGVLLP